MLKALLLIWTLQSSQSDSLLLVDSNEVLESVSGLRSEDKFEEAIKLLESVNEEDSNYYKIQATLLSTYNSAEQYDQTVLKSKELLQKSNDIRAQIYLSYGNALLSKELYDSAKQVYLEGLEQYPYHHILLYNLGIVNFRQKHYEVSKEYFKRCLKINPFYSSSHLMLGHISILEGLRTKGLMSYLTYLMIAPDNNSGLVTIENLVTDGLRYEGSVESNDTLFEEYDNLLKSKAAFDERFRYNVKFNASIVKQTELLISKLQPSNEDDFWAQFYLPMFLEIGRNKLVEMTLYKILQSTGSEDVVSYLEKNSSQADTWADVVNSELVLWRDKDEATLLGKTDVYDFWHYDNNNINAIGNKDAEENKIGPWVFYHDNSEVSAFGTYNDTGAKVGVWKYFFENGVMSRLETRDDSGNFSEPALYYREDGSIATEVPYEGEDVQGQVTYYYPCDQVKETVEYSNNKSNGKGVVYYETGAKNIDYSMSEGALQGEYTLYHQTGNVKSKYHFEAGNKEGKYQIVYHNGVVEEEGSYQEDLAEGQCVGAFSSGKKAYEGAFNQGNKIGNWKYFHENGQLRYEENYNEDGAYHGDLTFHNIEGFMESKITYDNGIQVAYAYYDDLGNVLSSGSDPEGNMPFERWRWTGFRYSKGTLKNGKLEGDYTIYYENGAVFQQGAMKEGSWHGPFTEYYPSGKVSFKGAYEEGLEQGYFVYYSKQGKKVNEGHFIDGQAQQRWISYYQNGQIEGASYFVDAEYQGWCQSYGPNGKLWSDMKYNEGSVVAYRLYDTLAQVYMERELPNASGSFDYLYPNGQINFSSLVACGYYMDKYKHYYPDGKLLSDRPMVNGVFHGDFKKYSHSGKVLIEGAYENNLRTGTWNYYTYDGKLERTYQYLDDELHGVYTRYYPNGQPESKISYYMGKRHGPSHYYDMQGNLQIIKYYDGEFGLVSFQYRGSDGELVDKIKFDHNMEKIEAFFPNGERSAFQEYKNGVLHGQTVYYSSDGKVLEEGFFKEGENQGDYIQYYPNGNERSKTTYLNDEVIGKSYEYFENGKVQIVREYSLDVQNGWERIFDATGKEIDTWYYWNDYIYE
ncbi:MAG: tetratricopeptide repeat protein [Marinoscillum sp.]